MVSIIRLRSQKISFVIVIALLINISAPLYSQALLEKAKSGISAVGKSLQDIDFTKGFQVAGQAIKALDIPGRMQEVARSVSSRIKNSLSEKLEQLKNLAPNVIIPKLLENIEKFGQQIGYVADCMFKGTCSEQQRAAFIAISITILALTVALVGFSITVAATSKEIDAQTVVISEQVKGWSPQAIVTRLKNTAAEFKQSLLGLQTCLLKRQCTANQKKGLYGFAITLVVLATIIVGIGVGSYIYAQQKEKERQGAVPTPGEKPQEKPVLGAMSAYTDLLPAWKTKFMQQVSKVIQPIKGAGATLKSAYETIQQDIQRGVIKTAAQAKELFEKITLKAKSIDELIRETLDVNIASALDRFNLLKNQFVEFKNALPELWNNQIMILKRQLEDIVAYGKQTADDLQNARSAWKNLNLGRIIQAKITSEREFANKKSQIALEQEQLSKEKLALQQEIDAFYASQEEVEPTGTIAKKPGIIQKVKQKIGKKPQDMSEQIRQKMADFEKRSKQLEQKEEKLNEKLTRLNQQIAFDQFVRKNNLDQIYPTFVEKLNGLDFNNLELVISDLLVRKIIAIIKAPTDLPMSGKIGLIVALGFTAAQNNIKGGIQHLVDGLERFGKYAKEAITVKPLITAPKMDSSDMALALLETAANIDFIKEAVSKLRYLLTMKQPMMQSVQNIEKAVGNLENAIKNFRSNITKKFVTTIEQSPLTNIPKAPIILLAALADGIRALKFAFIDTLKNAAELLQISLKVIPDAYLVANSFNEFFGKVIGAPFVNPKFMETVRVLQTASLPDINEGIKTLVNSLQEDTPDAAESAIPGS